jgi:hypothetical protein
MLEIALMNFIKIKIEKLKNRSLITSVIVFNTILFI